MMMLKNQNLEENKSCHERKLTVVILEDTRAQSILLFMFGGLISVALLAFDGLSLACKASTCQMKLSTV